MKNKGFLGVVALAVSTAGATAGSVLAAMPANAATANVGVSAGTLTSTISPTISLSSVTLSGLNQVSSGTLAVDVKDATGSGTGWKLQATSTQFKDTTTHTLPIAASTIAASGVTDVCDASSTCALASPTSTAAYTLPAASSAPTATTFYNAQANTGMGNQTATATFNVAIASNTFVPTGGSYTSTWTITQSSAP